MASAHYCTCELLLPDPSQRRSLNSEAGHSNLVVVNVLRSHVGFRPNPTEYIMCVTCFKQVTKGHKSMEVAQSITNSLSRSLESRRVVSIASQPQADQVDTAPKVKVPRRILFPKPSVSSVSSSSPTVQVWHDLF